MMQSPLIPVRRRRGGDDDLIPLINIVFLLLIFFMIAGQIAQTHGPDVVPPLSASEKPLPAPPVTLVVDRSNGLSLNGESIALEQLAGRLQALTGDAQADLALKVDQEVRAAELDTVLKVLRGSGLGKVTLFSRSEGD